MSIKSIQLDSIICYTILGYVLYYKQINNRFDRVHQIIWFFNILYVFNLLEKHHLRHSELRLSKLTSRLTNFFRVGKCDFFKNISGLFFFH